ncbi:MAG TPA: metallophosphoesterase [Frankiaceae bacterium]|nr:metallophosphoesterase [Frankiaceae bacterium]
MIRIAAFGDVHVGEDSRGRLREAFAHVSDQADVLLAAGDLTKCGSPDEAAILAEELAGVGVPVVAVLGNHDHHAGRAKEVMSVLRAAGIVVLEGSSTVVEVDGCRVGIAGTKGFGGGFAGASGSDFGEPEMKAFVGHTKALARRLHDALAPLDTDYRVALMHYSPVPDTLAGERLEIFPFLGSYLLAEAVDEAGCDLVLHGHAHAGTEKGVTAGGVHVRNVAQPVIRTAYALYCLGESPAASATERTMSAATSP